MLPAINKAIKSVVRSENAIEAEFGFSQEDPIFAGHFPGMPIIPAVYQVGLCRKIIEQDNKLSFSGIVKSRFSRMCMPGKDYSLKIALTKSESGMEAACSIHEKLEKQLCSKIVLLFS